MSSKPKAKLHNLEVLNKLKKEKNSKTVVSPNCPENMALKSNAVSSLDLFVQSGNKNFKYSDLSWLGKSEPHP